MILCGIAILTIEHLQLFQLNTIAADGYMPTMQSRRTFHRKMRSHYYKNQIIIC